MRHFLVAVLLLGLVSLAVSACGGDDDDDGGGGGLSKEEYIAQADALCGEANKRETDAGAPGPVAEIEQSVLEDIVANLDRTLADFRKLEAPDGDEDEVAKIVSDLESLHSAREAELAAARAKDGDAESDARSEFQTASQDLGVSAGAYGLTQCQGLGF